MRKETGIDLFTAYFRSGWAFLIPYLVVYVAYAWLQWPVNPTDSASGAFPFAPALLHVFWLFHALNLGLAITAFIAWSQRRKRTPVSGRENVLLSVLPWLLLALLFLIPRVSLEFPGDPWEHYARIVDWQSHLRVTSAPTWTKSSYFLAYSLWGWTSLPLRSLLLDLYSTGCALLLSWQYFRLARSAGVDARFALLFVVLHSLLFGNGPFGFFRYYGISSTLFAQLGAIALIRISLEQAVPQSSPPRAAPASLTMRISRALPAVGGLLLLIVFNHVQGLAIAALGVGACLVHAWRRQARPRLGLGLAALAAINVFIVCYCAWSGRVDMHGQFGWSAGFDLLRPSSFVFQRVAAVIGGFGLLNLVAGAWLVYRHHVVGCLTVFPLAVFFLPGFSLLLEAYFQERDALVFHRLLFAIPAGLALVVTAQRCLAGMAPTRINRLLPVGGFSVLLALVAVPAGTYWNNRLWHSFYQAPSDLSARWLESDAPRLASAGLPSRLGRELRAPEPVAYLLNALGTAATLSAPAADARRLEPHDLPPIFPSVPRLNSFAASASWYLPDAHAFFSPASQAAQLSHHWYPQAGSLTTAGMAEWAETLDGDPTITRGPALPSGALVFAAVPASLIQSFSQGLALEMAGGPPVRSLGKAGLQYRRDQPAYLRAVSPTEVPVFSSQAGLYRCRVRFQPVQGGADVLLNVVTAGGPDRIYLVHHRKGNLLYYYIGRQEVGPWPIIAPGGDEFELELAWSNGNQTLRVNGKVVLSSAAPTPDETVTGLLLGKDASAPERGLEGELLVEELRLLAIRAP